MLYAQSTSAVISGIIMRERERIPRKFHSSKDLNGIDAFGVFLMLWSLAVMSDVFL